MRKKRNEFFVIILSACLLLGGCSGKERGQAEEAKAVSSEAESQHFETENPSSETESQSPETEPEKEPALPDGSYKAKFHTDSSMFHVSEACEGKGILTVKDGEMTIHISLGSKKIVNLYPGLAEDASKEGAAVLMPTEDRVTYSDGMTEEVYGFDVPVPVLEEEFNLALVGTKGTWYDHKVSVSSPEPMEDEGHLPEGFLWEDGAYTIELSFEGGSGRAELLSPAALTIAGEKASAVIQWNSPNYDYMIVDGEKYLPVNTEGDSMFEIPVTAFDKPVKVIGDTVAMSKPHEIEYTLTFHSDTVKPAQ